MASPVRRERLTRSKQELAEEAAKVLRQADKVQCVVGRGTTPDRFFSLPHRKKSKLTPKPDYPSSSLDRRSVKRRGSLELQPPKKPPRTFASSQNTSSKPSIFDLFKKSTEPKKKSNLRRSVSDASALRNKSVKGQEDSVRSTAKKASSDNEESGRKSVTKKQLSPIIEVSQREDYFLPVEEGVDKENTNTANIQKKPSESITDQLKDYIDEIDEQLYKETGIRISSPSPQKDPPISKKDPSSHKKNPPVPVIIDLDKAEKISDGKKSKLNFGLTKKLKSFANKKPKSDDQLGKNRDGFGTGKSLPRRVENESSGVENRAEEKRNRRSASVEVEELEEPKVETSNMIHSSQQPAEKLPLTKGRTVNTMVKRLSSDTCASPPHMRTHVLISPNVSVQHNNNQPFSYTRGLSPDKCLSNENLALNGTKPVIYAQVVCNNNGNGLTNGKQTVHTAFTNGRRQPQSDSDEGLGGEEGSGITRKSGTHFGDDSFDSYTEQLLDEIDKYKAESPILPKYRNPVSLNGFTGLAERGRADGMDSKRRESLTEQENDIIPHRTDLATRRNLLESRMNRRMSDKTATPSPEHPSSRPGPTNNVYITESSSKYYRSGSTSPVGFKEKYISTSHRDKYGERRTESRTKKYFGEPQDNLSNGFDSFDSQHSTGDYRSYRPEKPHLSKDRDVYKSTPEIRHLEARNVGHAYHGSLPRGEKIQSRNVGRKFRSERHLDLVEDGREVKSSGTSRESRNRQEVYNDSEDEGFASSLLIASEKQHTDDSLARKSRRDYDSDRNYPKEDESYRLGDSRDTPRYIPRERSIDDGSHFDPRLDKELERSTTTLKRVEKKPPKPEKKSGLEKVKSLFMRDNKKKKEKAMVKEKKTRDQVDNKFDTNSDYKNRRRLSTPSPSPTRQPSRKTTSEISHNNSWFKSLDRITRRKSNKAEKDTNYTSTEEETIVAHNKFSNSNKNLRFFGDTDQESNGDSLRGLRTPKARPGLRAQSTRDLHNISEEVQRSTRRPETLHKSLTNISKTDRDLKGSRSNLKPPISPSPRYRREERPRRRRQDISSVESSTEGDSSQQSQRSIVYLHAATVGDIPGPDYLRHGSRRAASREDLTSNGGSSSLVQPQVKTLSRSFSVLAPWRPRHRREGLELDYAAQAPTPPARRGKYEQRATRNGGGGGTRSTDGSTLKRRTQQEQGKKLGSKGRSRSRENVSGREDVPRGSTATLYKKKDKLPRENSRYNNREERRMPSSKSHSVESISRRAREEGGRDVSRSVSMPRDTAKSAGWFRKSKKSGRD